MLLEREKECVKLTQQLRSVCETFTILTPWSIHEVFSILFVPFVYMCFYLSDVHVRRKKGIEKMRFDGRMYWKVLPD